MKFRRAWACGVPNRRFQNSTAGCWEGILLKYISLSLFNLIAGDQLTLIPGKSLSNELGLINKQLSVRRQNNLLESPSLFSTNHQWLKWIFPNFFQIWTQHLHWVARWLLHVVLNLRQETCPCSIVSSRPYSTNYFRFGLLFSWRKCLLGVNVRHPVWIKYVSMFLLKITDCFMLQLKQHHEMQQQILLQQFHVQQQQLAEEHQKQLQVSHQVPVC